MAVRRVFDHKIFIGPHFSSASIGFPYDQLALVVLAAPLAFVTAAVVAQMNPGSRPRATEWAIRRASDLGLLAAATGAVLTIRHGLLLSPTLGRQGLGLSVRLDPLTIVMLCMVSLLAALIVRYSLNYLAGDDRQGVFLGRLAVTIAAVEVLVVSGNLVLLVGAWVATSLFLYRLLLFYDERPGAQVAGRKRFIATRIGDACLIAAATLLYVQLGTGDLEQIFTALEAADPVRWSLEATGMAALGIALAGALMAAQFPTHGWLVEVMETPTPVSTLLHAGILNAGPFLVARFTFVVDGSTLAQSFLIVVGGFTVLFSSTTLLTQTAIKKALGYSSAAHMGFMLMVCGFGVYPAARPSASHPRQHRHRCGLLRRLCPALGHQPVARTGTPGDQGAARPGARADYRPGEPIRRPPLRAPKECRPPVPDRDSGGAGRC
ncbi:MAG: hypothetical protein BRD55_03560 [Bacteroidetes bacterium SW_9_63_38]|nr:MAG: hypothetical protein BRD55_03560 [Bacteroidetes bacterium SW_9_63_38]